MANNFSIWDYLAGAAKNFKSTDNATIHTPHHNVDIIAANENHLGEVGGSTITKDVQLTLTAVSYNINTVIAASQQIDAIFRKTDGTGLIQSIMVIDKDDQKAALDIYFLDSSTASFGSENALPTLSDTDALTVYGPVSVVTADYKDLGGVSIARIGNIGLPVKAVSGTDDLYVAVVSAGSTPTYTASGVLLRVGVLRD